ncbi:MAG TPA: hypothetical protein VK503_07670 [Candidatus Bathyarchaeia archaeon]|nr:hypothetical protein [Candidatus Bathyarchaeia archaeon]
MAKTKTRKCPECGMTFKAMTDGQWENVKRLHRPSQRHKRRKAAKSRA